MDAPPRHANRLAAEKSPYLLQHARNPVDWYPWGEEAFASARAENKLIFLSIGYSTCHWCHVMERESFEDMDVAAVLNTLTVPIKVDREERPDVDQVYMAVCQALNGSGGWPLNVLLTPDRVPFFAGTYFPKHSRHGRIGVIELVRQAAALWQGDPERVRSSGRQIVDQLRAAAVRGQQPAALSPAVLSQATELLREQFDTARGGFGQAPKFPTPHNLVFLVRRHRRTGDPEPLRMAEATLDGMRRGGLFDHVGFGFHRYATDANWLVPHFEKMLYDQAGLALAYLEAFQATGKAAYGQTAREIFVYVLRDLASP
ncbi:MAG: thioredoxin domain-containing protein, partial [Proteobacteria bacterium]|nr:thioredoxin domain-containing protein [Pseudomonadota bacterium]